ncbi:MAG: zinc-binding dehydrogenase [Gammaproteobacteria bacterium]|nr:zinc-binding dehydrogenase [Gammaproteobacteria bacterium]
MKAVVLTETVGPKGLQIQEIETPQPAAGEVRVKLKTSALNRRDYWITIGKYPGVSCPCIAGSDGAGIVDAVGDGADASAIGKEVVVYPARAWGDSEEKCGPEFRVLGLPDQGTFAEYICVPESDIYDKPEHLNWEQAAAIPLAGLTAWRAVVTQAEVKSGHKVLVTGAGSGVSTFALQWAIGQGAEVYVTSGSAEKMEKAKALGASGAVNYRDEDFTKQLRKMSGGFDAIIDSAGGDSLNAILDTLNPAGRFVFFGATMGTASTGLEIPKLFFRHIRIQGTMMGSPSEFAAMMNFVAENKIEPVVHEVLSMDEAVAAHELMENFSQMGKIVLRNE